MFQGREARAGESHLLRIPAGCVPKLGKDDIIEALVTKPSEPNKEYHLYTCLSHVAPHINIARIHPAPREEFNVLSLEIFDKSDFVRDFNRLKPLHLENVRLSYSEGILQMKVDTNSTVIRDPKLLIDGSRVYLEGRVLESRTIGVMRIGKINETFSARFADTAPIIYMKANGGFIEAGYVQSRREPDHRTRLIPATRDEAQREEVQADLTRHRLLEMDKSTVSKAEIRAWIDTEGSIDPGSQGRRTAMIAVTQKHREPLESFARGVQEMGVRCKIRQTKRGMFVAMVVDIEGVARVIKEVGPFRTPQRIDQVRRLMERLKTPRAGVSRRRVIERSKTLLEL